MASQTDKKHSDQLLESIRHHIADEKTTRENRQGLAYPYDKWTPYSHLQDELAKQIIVIPKEIRDELVRELREIYRKEVKWTTS